MPASYISIRDCTFYIYHIYGLLANTKNIYIHIDSCHIFVGAKGFCGDEVTESNTIRFTKCLFEGVNFF